MFVLTNDSNYTNDPNCWVNKKISAICIDILTDFKVINT